MANVAHSKIDLAAVNNPDEPDQLLRVDEMDMPGLADMLPAHMHQPLGLPAGTYTVLGIEGAASYYNGPDLPPGQPFTVQVTPASTPYNICMAVFYWYAGQGAIMVDHQYFEYLTAVEGNNVLYFSMGS